jgi:hypothetical protein
VVYNHLWSIWCEVEKDVTVDHGAGWLKSGDGGFETLCTLELTQARTNQLEQERNGNPKRIAAYVASPGQSGFVENRSHVEKSASLFGNACADTMLGTIMCSCEI